MKSLTFEILITDQRERIERCNLKEGDNIILDYINDFNEVKYSNHERDK